MPRFPSTAARKRHFAASPTSSKPTSKRKRHKQLPPEPPAVLPPDPHIVSSPLYTRTGIPIPLSELPLSAVFFQHRQLLKCATYNTFSCSPAHSPHQTRSLLSIIHNLNADVISLQEVSAAFYRALMEQEGTGEYYASSLERYFEVAGLGVGGKGGKQGGREGVVLLVKKELVGRGSEVRMVMMESARGEGGKALLVLKLVHEGVEKIRVVSSHFSSLPSNAPLRDRQYTLAHSILRQNDAPVSIVMGDFNISAAFELESLASLVDSVFCRVPETVDLFRDGPTFGNLYPYVPGAPRNKPRKGRRIDRILVSGQDVSCSDYALFGGDMVRDEKGVVVRDREGLQGVMWPSDHLGVSVIVSME